MGGKEAEGGAYLEVQSITHCNRVNEVMLLLLTSASGNETKQASWNEVPGTVLITIDLLCEASLYKLQFI